jgi:hypothetical protein
VTAPPGAGNVTGARILERLLADPTALDRSALAALGSLGEAALDEVFRAFAAQHGADALPTLTTLAEAPAERGVRRAAKRALYRLAQRGVTPPPRPAAKPVVKRRAEGATRAWISGVDGSGSRATWILFDADFGGSSLCSLIVNDTIGVVEVAGGEITRKRLEAELANLRANQKLPWVETEPPRAVGLVAEALALHRALGTSPPPTFERWAPLFASVAPPEPPRVPVDADPALAERGPQLLELPELAGWFLDPEGVQSDALELLQLRESRLVVSDQIKTEREDAILTRVVEREMPPEERRRWMRRLVEMAYVFRATERAELAGIAEATAASLEGDAGRSPFARGLARRALELAGEVSAGRLSAAEVSRKPTPTGATAAR